MTQPSAGAALAHRRYVRALSATERSWLTAAALCPPFAISLVLEATPGDPLDADAWARAVDAAATVNPGVRVALRGVLGWSRWVDVDVRPPVQRVDAPGWDGTGPEGAAFLSRPLPVREGPICEVWLVAGALPRVVFRCHHAAMDGRGLLFFAQETLRALRGEALLGSPSVVTDLELAQARGQRRREPPNDSLAATGLHDGGAPTTTWLRRSVPLTQGHAFLPRVACLVAQAAREGGEGAVRFDIPVDLRTRSGPEPIRSTGNLTGLLRLEVAPGAAPAEVAEQLRQRLDGGNACDRIVSIAGLRWVPLGLMQRVAAGQMAAENRRSRYGVTGVLSNLGVLDLAALRAPGLRTERAFFIPPAGHATAVFAMFTGHAAGVEMVASMPTPLASKGRLAALLDRVAEGLMSSEVPA